MAVSAPPREQEAQPFEVVGQRVRPTNAVSKCVGSARFASDMQMPGMLWMKILRSPHARARIVDIQTDEALAMPGVEAVLTYRNVPSTPWGANPALQQEGVPVLSDRVNFVGDAVAAVAAADPDVLEEAAGRIKVVYQVLPPVLDPFEAGQTGTEQIHPYGNVICGTPDQPSAQSGRGDVESGLAEADVVIERVFRQPPVQPVPHEPRGCLAYWDGESLTVWDSTQKLFHTRETLCELLELPEDRVRVIATNVGGSFGSKDTPSRYALLAALISRQTGKPVKVWFTREEETLDGHLRGGVVHMVKAGIRRDGRITAMKMRSYLDNGYWGGMQGAPATGVSYARALCNWSLDLYKQIPNWQWDVFLVRTNRSRSGPVRSRSSAEALFAVESVLDDLASAVNADPCELRIRYAIRTGQLVEAVRADGHEPRPSSRVGFSECIRAGREAIGWERRNPVPGSQPGPKKRGIGMAGAITQAGSVPPHIANCEVAVDATGRVMLYDGTPDQGSEQQTTLRQIVAEGLGLPFGAIDSTYADTAFCLYDSGPVASRTVFAMGTAVWRGTEKLRQQILAHAAEMLGEPEEQLQVRDGQVWLEAEQRPVATLGQVAAFAGGEIRCHGRFHGAEEPTYTYGFAACFVELEVDVETGEVRVLRVVSSHDVGKAVNPEIVEGQIEGGVAMGLGYALSEGLMYDPHNGAPLNQWFLDLKTPVSLDTPAIEPILLELGNEGHPLGVRGCSEISLAGVAPAVRNAIYNATGARVNQLPITPDGVLAALYGGQSGNGTAAAPRF